MLEATLSQNAFFCAGTAAHRVGPAHSVCHLTSHDTLSQGMLCEHHDEQHGKLYVVRCEPIKNNTLQHCPPESQTKHTSIFIFCVLT